MSTPDDRSPNQASPGSPAPPRESGTWAASAADSDRVAILMATLEGIADGVAVADTSGRFLLFNPAAERILRAGQVDVGLKKWSEHYGLFLPDGETPFPIERLPLVRAMQGETVEETEILVRHADAPDGIWISVKATPFRNVAGEISGGIAVFRDVTERKRMEREVVLAKERAEEASRAKGTFLATMSHEIRTPLNAILGMAHLLRRSSLTPQQHELLQVIQESGRSLLSLIEETLDLSKIEAGRVVMERIPFEPRQIVGRAVRIVAQRAHEKGLELAFRVDRAVPERVIGDPGRLRQVLLNLIGNALKFTDRGEVTINVTVEAQRPGKVTLRYAVSDTGIGIPPEKQLKIFDSFAQADGSTSRRYGGTGLGLAIASRFVELMGGRIEVESEVDHGSTFAFTAVYESADSAPPRPLREWEGARVLIVDAHRTSRAFLAELLADLGLMPEIPPDGEEIQPLLRSAVPPFRLLFVDTPGPEGGGIPLIESLGDLPEPRPDTILLLPSGAPPEDLDRADALGVHQYLPKPVQVGELRRVLERLHRVSPDPESRRDLSPATPRPLRVLVVEDSAANRILAARLLEGWGHRVHAAGTGVEAIEIGLREQLDLVLMDLEMPEMDGVEATRHLRRLQGPDRPHLPVIAMTAHAIPEERERCLAAGMDGFLTKPIDIEGLRLTLDRLGSPPNPF